MSRKGVKTAGKAEFNPNFTTFVNYTIPPEMYDEIEEVYGKADDVYAGFVTLLEAGYRVGFTYDANRRAVICSLTCRNDQSVNHGKTMTSFSSTWWNALRSALFKHYVCLDTDWGTAQAQDTVPLFG